jgi:hypothetical protein
LNNSMEPSDLIAPFTETNILCYTSLSFLAPAYYAYQKNIPFLSTLLCLTSLISYSYWSYPLINGFYRKLDLIFSKISFGICFGYGMIYVQEPQCYLGYGIFLSMICNYWLSNSMYYLKQKTWSNYHAVFHLCVMTEQILIVYCLEPNV